MKIVRLCLLVALALLWGISSVSAQGWIARYSGGDDCSPVDIKVGSDGSTYVVGARVVGAQVDTLLLKYDTTGNLVWVSSYAGTVGGDDAPAHMALDSNNNIYLTGVSYRGATTGFDIVTLKFDSNGVQQWVRVYNASGNNDDQSSGILVDSSGNAYIVGTIFRTTIPSPKLSGLQQQLGLMEYSCNDQKTTEELQSPCPIFYHLS